MRKILLVIALFSTIYSRAQWFDVSANVGVAPFKISAGLKNGFAGSYNVSLSLIKLKVLYLGVQFSGLTSITLCSTMAPGVFADFVIEKDKNIITLGVHDNYMLYGDIPRGGQYYKDGSRDTVGIKLDNTMAYGIRLGYRRQFKEHFYGYVLVSPTYSISPIHIGPAVVKNCAVFSVPVMLGMSLRF